MRHALLVLPLLTSFALGCGDDGSTPDATADACDGRAILRVCVVDSGGNPDSTATVSMIQSPGDVPYEGHVDAEGCTENPVETNLPWQVSASTPGMCFTDGATEAAVTACMTTEITVTLDLCAG